MAKIESVQVFNSPLETGLRLLVLIKAFQFVSLDHQRILYLDYLMVHSYDFQSELPSIHSRSPSRIGELLVKREITRQALDLLVSRGLVAKEYLREGIFFRTTKLGLDFLNFFESSYFHAIEARAEWVFMTFRSVDNLEIKRLLDEQIGRMDTELENYLSVGEHIREKVHS